MQDQFLEVVTADVAHQRFRAAVQPRPLGEELVDLTEALGRVLSRPVAAAVDVPCFDRSNFDGFALQAADTHGASELVPRTLRLLPQSVAMGRTPDFEIQAGQAAAISTGGMLPRGADAVLLVEQADVEGDRLVVRRALAAGAGLSFAGSDLARGEIVLPAGEVLTSRETGLLAAIGLSRAAVWRRPRVAVFSTGDEIVPPGAAIRPGQVFDSNSRIIADAVREAGGEPLEMGVVPDQLALLSARLREALSQADLVLLSGGTSKGGGDWCYQAVAQLSHPGIVAHGVALKPGKPLCLAAEHGKGVAVLPGFPTSAIFTFHEFIAPVIRELGGRPAGQTAAVEATLSVQVNSEIGRTEYLLVGLVPAADPVAGKLTAFPMGKGSGSVSTFSKADGFVTIDRHQEILPAGATVRVQLLSRGWRAADLIVIGSHCAGLDWLLGELQRRGFSARFLPVGSTAGLEAARRGQCDLAGMHLLDETTGQYNRPFLDHTLRLVRGYGRWQGLVFRPGDPRFAGKTAEQAIRDVARDESCRMIHRNPGSGTRILLERLLAGLRPAGYPVQAKSHTAVAAAVSQGRADWGLAISTVAADHGLGFLPLAWEEYDFAVPLSRQDRPAVRAFCELLASPAARQRLKELGFRPALGGTPGDE